MEEADLKASRQLVNPVVTELHCCVNVCTDTEELLLTVVWRRSSPPASKLGLLGVAWPTASCKHTARSKTKEAGLENILAEINERCWLVQSINQRQETDDGGLGR